MDISGNNLSLPLLQEETKTPDFQKLSDQSSGGPLSPKEDNRKFKWFRRTSIQFGKKKLDNNEFIKPSETNDLQEEEYDVYPLSQKFTSKDTKKLLWTRGIFISILLLFFFIVAADLWERNIFRDLPIGLGYFKDRIRTVKLPLEQANKFYIRSTN